jgi:ribosomal protein L7/L12
VPCDRPGADLPPSVRELALNGKMIQAVKKLMKLTGVSMAEAKHRLDNL